MPLQMMNHPEVSKYDTSSLKSVGGGGAPTPPSQAKQITSKFKNARPGQGYGLTETNALTCLNAGDDYLSRPTSCG